MSNKVEMHKKICEELNDLYERKNADYGESFAELRKEYPESICIRLTDKLNRLKKLTSADYKQNVKDESVEDTLKDIANYAIMELVERDHAKENSLYGFMSNPYRGSDTQKTFENTAGFLNQIYANDATLTKELINEPICNCTIKHHGIKGREWIKRRKEHKSILIAFYNYDLNKHIQNLQLVYNNTIVMTFPDNPGKIRCLKWRSISTHFWMAYIQTTLADQCLLRICLEGMLFG